jgi:hypothetical protein
MLLPLLAFAQAERATCERDQAKVSVACELKYADRAQEVKIRFKNCRLATKDVELHAGDQTLK